MLTRLTAVTYVAGFVVRSSVLTPIESHRESHAVSHPIQSQTPQRGAKWQRRRHEAGDGIRNRRLIGARGAEVVPTTPVRDENGQRRPQCSGRRGFEDRGGAGPNDPVYCIPPSRSESCDQ